MIARPAAKGLWAYGDACDEERACAIDKRARGGPDWARRVVGCARALAVLTRPGATGERRRGGWDRRVLTARPPPTVHAIAMAVWRRHAARVRALDGLQLQRAAPGRLAYSKVGSAAGVGPGAGPGGPAADVQASGADHGGGGAAARVASHGRRGEITQDRAEQRAVSAVWRPAEAHYARRRRHYQVPHHHSDPPVHTPYPLSSTPT